MPDALEGVPFPSMMLQTLVENAIKHGARAQDRRRHDLDHGRRQGRARRGHGRRRRQRARRRRRRAAASACATCANGSTLPTAPTQSFDLAANFPAGVAATITVPTAGPTEARSPMDKRVTCVIAEDEQLFRDALLELLRAGMAGPRRRRRRATTAARRWRRSASTSPTSRSSTSACPGLTGLEVAAAAADVEPRHAGGVRHRLRPVRDPGVRARRRRLPPEADRARAAGRHASRGCARASATRARRTRRCSQLIRDLAVERAGEARRAAARVDHRERGQGDAPHHGRRRRLLQVGQQVHDGDDGAGRVAPAHVAAGATGEARRRRTSSRFTAARS